MPTFPFVFSRFSDMPCFDYVHYCVFEFCFICFFGYALFSAMPTRLRPLFGTFRLCPLFFRSHVSAMPFVRLRPLFFLLAFRLCHFPAMPATVFIVLLFFRPCKPVAQMRLAVRGHLYSQWRLSHLFPPTTIYNFFKRASDV